MALDREALVVALYERLKARVDGIVFWSRRDVAPGEVRMQPAILLLCRGQTARNQAELPPIWDIDLEIVVLVTCKREDDSPDTQLNQFLQKIDEALVLQSNESQPYQAGTEDTTTLDGRAVRCAISGTVERFPGEASGQGILIVPITITAFEQ